AAEGWVISVGPAPGGNGSDEGSTAVSVPQATSAVAAACEDVPGSDDIGAGLDSGTAPDDAVSAPVETPWASAAGAPCGSSDVVSGLVEIVGAVSLSVGLVSWSVISDAPASASALDGASVAAAAGG